MNAAFEDPHSLSTLYGRIDCGTIMNGKCLIRTERFSGCYQGWQELSDYQLFGSFTVTAQDAKEYLYSISKTRRVHRFQNFKVNLYI